MKLFLMMSVCLFLSACSTSKTSEKTVIATPEKTVTQVNETDQIDFDKAVRTLVKHMMKSGVLKTDNEEKSKLFLSRIVNQTSKEFDLSALKKKLQFHLKNTEKIQVVDGKSGVKPEFVLSGKITSRIAHVRGQKRTEYYLYLMLSGARTGTVFWENQTPVLKRKTR